MKTESTRIVSALALSLMCLTAHAWRYEESDDKMAGGKVKSAIARSLNDVQFSFPYQGKQSGMLMLRRHPRYGKDVILSIDKGQFLCGVGGCNVTVKFGNGKPEVFNAGPPSDHDSTYLFIRNHDRFVAAAKKVDKILIEAQFFREGTRIFEFDVSGLKW